MKVLIKGALTVSNAKPARRECIQYDRMEAPCNAGTRPRDDLYLLRTFTKRDVEVFGDITRDYNPVHYEERFIRVKGFAGLICHGLLVGSMVCEVGGQVGWPASGMKFRFLSPVYIGNTITAS